MGRNFFSRFKKSVINPVKSGFHELQEYAGDSIEHIFHKRGLPDISLQTGGKILAGIGTGLEVVGAVTAQPELIAAGAGLGIVGGVVEGVGTAVKTFKGTKGEEGEEDVRGAKGKGVSAFGAVVAGLAPALAKLTNLEKEEIEKITGLGEKVEKFGGHITKVEDEINKMNDRLVKNERQEATADRTHNELLQKVLHENQLEHQHAETNKQIVLDKELQSQAELAREEEDVLNQIRTALDRPTSVADFIKDISNLNNGKAIIEYIAENQDIFNALPLSSQNQILDLALGKGALSTLQ